MLQPDAATGLFRYGVRIAKLTIFQVPPSLRQMHTRVPLSSTTFAILKPVM